MALDIALVVGTLFGVAAYLLLARSLKLVVFGFIILSNGVNILLLSMSGSPAGLLAPILDQTNPLFAVDPLPQALILTAIVIGYGIISFLIFFIFKVQSTDGH